MKIEYLVYIVKKQGEISMGVITVRCPKCGETRTTTPNTGFTCRGCGARISVGPDGKIRSATSGRK